MKFQLLKRPLYECHIDVKEAIEAGISVNVEKIEDAGFDLEHMPSIVILSFVSFEDANNPAVEFWYKLEGYGRVYLSISIPLEGDADFMDVMKNYIPVVLTDHIDWELLGEHI